MEYVYLTKEDILEYHNDIINEIGGSHGVREEGGIERIVDFIQNDLYYPTLVDKLTYLVFGLCSGHYFMDGNKRISIVAAAHFLIKNKKLWAGARFFEYFHSSALSEVIGQQYTSPTFITPNSSSKSPSKSILLQG